MVAPSRPSRGEGVLVVSHQERQPRRIVLNLEMDRRREAPPYRGDAPLLHATQVEARPGVPELKYAILE